MSFAKYRYLIFGILGTAYILAMFHRLAPAVVAVDMMRDLKTGGALMGILSSAYFYPYALMQIPAGLLSDSWGPRRSVALFFIFASAGSVALGFAQSVGMAIAARIIVGIGVATVFVPTLKILTNWFEPAKFVRMTGILMSLGGVGAYMASAPLALLSDAFGWRGSMIVIGGFTGLIALAVWWLVKDTPQERGYPPLRWTINPENMGSKIGLLSGIGLVLKTPAFWPMAGCTFLGAMVSLSLSGLWGGPFLMHVYRMSRAQTGAILSAMAVGVIIGAPSMSWLANRVLHSRKKVLVLNYILGLCLFFPLAFFTGDFSITMLYVWCFSYSFMMSGMVVGYSLVKDMFPGAISGTATGILNIFPFAGAALGQPLIGWYLDSVGSVGGIYSVHAYSSAFKICLIFLFGALVASILVKETYPKNQVAAQTLPLIQQE
jgi:sugar phosphate permease